MDQPAASQVLARFGTVKNPVLFTSGSFSSAMLWFGYDLVRVGLPMQFAAGAAMVLFSVLVFLSGIGFYAYAFLHLPATTQELVFLQEAKVALDQHHRTVARTARRRNTVSNQTARSPE